jgi:hypothetical protein
MDFEANAKEGRRLSLAGHYDEIAPWYDKAEIFAGHLGQQGRPAAAPRRPLPAAARPQLRRAGLQEGLADKLGRKLIIGRCANLTAPLTHNESPQRGTCQARNMCIAAVLRRIFLERVGDAAVGRAHRQHDAHAEPDRLRAHLRRSRRAAPPACASSTPRRASRPTTSRRSCSCARRRSGQRTSC